MSFSITILGCSSALPTSQRFPTAQILNVSEQFFLIDCGEGTQIQIRKFKIRFNKINHIFISHLHGDHFFGLFGLLSTFNMLNRKNDLHIYGPPQLEEIISLQLNFLEQLYYKIIFHKLNNKTPEIIYENEKLTVETIPLTHRIPCTGFLFKEKTKQKNIKKDFIEKYNLSIKDIISIKNGNDFTLESGEIIPNATLTIPGIQPRSYAYCSDTIYKEDIVPQIENTDLLYHEATYAQNMEKRAKETFHSTALQAAKIASKAKVKRLLIGHFSARYKDLNILLKEAKSIFPETYLAEDGKIFEI